MKKFNQQSGFVILYAVLLTSVVLGIGILLLSIIAKQIQLSSLEKSSQAAYYAADAGRQCALLWDQNDGAHDAFGHFSEGVTGEKQYNSSVSEATPTCFGGPITTFTQTENVLGDGGTFGTSSFKFNSTVNNAGNPKTCVQVVVSKSINNGLAMTTITSNGYNQASCDGSSLAKTNLRRVQRTIVITKE